MTNNQVNYYKYYDSPLGMLLLINRTGSLNGIFFEGHKPYPKLCLNMVVNNTVFSTTEKSLDSYFKTGTNSKLPEFELIGTEFQKSVWNILLSIKPGQTITYSDIANKLNKPNACRAVGAAVGRNPISILIPCHRVVGVSGLTGYAGGIDRKRWLLNHEESMHLSLAQST